MYRILYHNGPVFEKPSLPAAKKYVERYTPLKKGWEGSWSSPRPGVHLYGVTNSKGRVVNVVRVSRIIKGH